MNSKTLLIIIVVAILIVIGLVFFSGKTPTELKDIEAALVGSTNLDEEEPSPFEIWVHDGIEKWTKQKKPLGLAVSISYPEGATLQSFTGIIDEVHVAEGTASAGGGAPGTAVFYPFKVEADKATYIFIWWTSSATTIGPHTLDLTARVLTTGQNATGTSARLKTVTKRIDLVVNPPGRWAK